MNTDELVEELEAFDQQYRKNYKTLRAAAYAAGLRTEFHKWLLSSDGQRYIAFANAHDHLRDNELRKAQREAEVNMASRARKALRRGHMVDGDQL